MKAASTKFPDAVSAVSLPAGQVWNGSGDGEAVVPWEQAPPEPERRPRMVSEDGAIFRQDAEWPGPPAGTEWSDWDVQEVPAPQKGAAQSMYECDCCERRNVPAKSKGIGYLCEDCLPSWTWDYGRLPESASVRPDHRAGRACPFREEAP